MCDQKIELYASTSNNELPVEQESRKNQLIPHLQDADFQEEVLPHISSKIVGLNAKLVCDGDDRNKADATARPFRAICKLIITDNYNNAYMGTGFFISPTCIATSGHCVFNEGEWVKEVRVIPGSNGRGDAPFGQETSRTFRSVKGWTVDRRRDFDYGAILLSDKTLYEKVGAFFRLNTLSSRPTLLNSGYPGDKNGDQWQCSGKVKEQTQFRIYYMIDTEKGNSGSPVIVSDSAGDYVVGIHSYGKCPNFCIAINNKIMEQMDQWAKTVLTT